MVAGGKAYRRKRGEDMKVIQAKEMMKAMHNALIRVGLVVPGLLLYMWILPVFMEVPRIFYAIVLLAIVVVVYRSGVCPGIRIYCTHWMKYGDGKVVIKRLRKELINGRPTGRWKSGEEEFLLKDLESCGVSLPVLGEYVEYHPIMSYGVSKECFFQLKNGKMQGNEMRYYLPEEMDELFRYIYEETGIVFQTGEATEGQAGIGVGAGIQMESLTGE